MLLRLFAIATWLACASSQTTQSLDTPAFSVLINKDAQTLHSLKSKVSSFDFAPVDKMSLRNANGNYHLGDVSFRARQVGTTAWIAGSSATARQALTAQAAAGTVLASANLAPTLPTTSLLNITRKWAVVNNTFQLLFDVTNSKTFAVEIGALGAALEFNNIFTDRTTAQTNALCSLFDPYIGQDAGYVQVTPLLSTASPPLLVLPVGKSPLEGWRFLSEPGGQTAYQSQVFEGLYEWQFHTLAYAQNEWASIAPWNAATSVTLQPGQTRTYGLKFVMASSVRGIDDALKAASRPVTFAIPGYILPADQTGKLFLNYPSAVQSISVTPTGSLTWTANSEATTAGWVGYTLKAVGWGRSRLTITYADGTVQTVHYYLTKNAVQAISDLGNFLTTNQWFNNASDPFKRSPSIISYDREVNAIVKDDQRAWIPGLSDEAGAGSWLAAAFKQFVQPNQAEVTKLEQFISQVLFGSVQNTDGSVKKSVYFYEPALVSYSYPGSISFTNWWSWNRAASFATDRAYDYVHVIAAYWSLYRVARNYPALVTTHTWQWYLSQAVLTVTSMTRGGVGNANDGLMGETVILMLLNDLKREGLTANATTVESRMKTRQTSWSQQAYPWGSEMAWDSTGQEGVAAWSRYFNDTKTTTNALNSVLSYQPTVPHWGYNGNARRYWDNIYGGKLMRYERQIHHYGSGLNALVAISAFQANPTDTYLLRVGFGGLSGPMSNIDQGGFASASFHSFADTLKWDGYSGDYGPNFAGLSMGMSTFIFLSPDFGWQSFGGNVISTSTTVQVQPKDAVRRRVFIAPLGYLLTLDAGAFSLISYNPSTKAVDVTIQAAPDGTTISGLASAPTGRLVLTKTATVSGVGTLAPSTTLSQDAGAWLIPFSSGQGKVTLVVS